MAATAPNMGLRVWNLLTDPYDHSQLASNWAKVDQHDHTTGKGVQIPTGGIVDGAISAAKIGNEQVTAEKLSTSAAESGGINTSSRTYRKVVANEEVYKNETTGYTVVDSGTVYVPSKGRVTVSYFALQKAGTATANAQIFVDGNELKVPRAGGAPIAATVASLETASFFGLLRTGTEALTVTKGETADSSLVTTGMSGSQGLVIWNLAAGEHTIEIKAKAGSLGKIEIKNRFLWLRSEAFS